MADSLLPNSSASAFCVYLTFVSFEVQFANSAPSSAVKNWLGVLMVGIRLDR